MGRISVDAIMYPAANPIIGCGLFRRNRMNEAMAGTYSIATITSTIYSDKTIKTKPINPMNRNKSGVLSALKAIIDEYIDGRHINVSKIFSNGFTARPSS